MEHIAGYFELLRRSIHAAPRPPVLENIRPAFKVFLEGLDLRNKRRDVDAPKVRTNDPLKRVGLLKLVTGGGCRSRCVCSVRHKIERYGVQAIVPQVIRLGVHR